MSQTETARSVDLPLSQVNDNLTRCPKCQGTHVFLEGDFLRHYVEEFKDGHSEEINLGERCKLVSKITCQQCNIRFNLMPDELFNEKTDNMRIRIELAKRDGLMQSTDSKPIVH